MVIKSTSFAEQRWVRLSLVVLLVLAASPPVEAAASANGQLTWALHVALAPTWFDPAETAGILLPFMILYGLHTPP